MRRRAEVRRCALLGGEMRPPREPAPEAGGEAVGLGAERGLAGLPGGLREAAGEEKATAGLRARAG